MNERVHSIPPARIAFAAKAAGVAAAALAVLAAAACSGSGGGQAAGSPTPSPIFKTILPSANPTPAPLKTGCTDATGPAQPDDKAGQQLAQYTGLQLDQGESVPFQPGVAALQPTAECNTYDLGYNGNQTFGTDPGGFAGLGSTAISFQNCFGEAQNPTNSFTPTLAVPAGQGFCYVGHGDVVGVTVVGYGSSGGTAYATVDISVWDN